MATTVKATCVICGEVTFDGGRISLIAYSRGRPSHCVWRCPRCDEPRLQAVDDETRAKLLAVRTRVLRIPIEPARTGRLKLDDMIDINDDLEQL